MNRLPIQHPHSTVKPSDWPEYRVWEQIKQRCLNPSNPAFPHYGGRGITIHQAWSNSFAHFFRDCGPRPSTDCTLDRINNSRGYEPGNIRWATRREQSNNTRRNVWLEYGGSTMTVAQWARKLGIKPKTIYRRLYCGLSTEDALKPLPRKDGWRHEN